MEKAFPCPTLCPDQSIHSSPTISSTAECPFYSQGGELAGDAVCVSAIGEDPYSFRPAQNLYLASRHLRRKFLVSERFEESGCLSTRLSKSGSVNLTAIDRVHVRCFFHQRKDADPGPEPQVLQPHRHSMAGAQAEILRYFGLPQLRGRDGANIKTR